jgi:hypothetical protein
MLYLMVSVLFVLSVLAGVGAMVFPCGAHPQWTKRRRACSDSRASRERREKSSTSTMSNCFALAA